MPRRFVYSIAALAALITAPAQATDYFIKVDGIPGTSNLVRMTDYIHVQSWSLDFSDGVCHGLNFVKHMDASSPLFTGAALSGAVYPTIILIAQRPGNNPFNFLRLTLTNSVFTSFKSGGTTGGEPAVPVEYIGIKPSRVKTDLFQEDIKGQRVLVSSSVVNCP